MPQIRFQLGWKDQIVSIRAIILALLFAVGAGSFLPSQQLAADERTDEKLSAEVKNLIRELDANQLSIRRNAETQLLKLGPAVLPHFPPPELISRPGVRQTLKRLRLQLERQQARLSTKASVVELTGNYTLADLIKQIERQTGNRLATDQLPRDLLNRDVDVSFNKRKFWSVLDDLAARFELEYQFPPGHGALELMVQNKQNTSHPVAVSYSGPFRIAVESILWRNKHNDVRVTLKVAAEPRLRPLFLSYAASDWNGVTADGKTLLPRDLEAQWELPLGEGGRTTKIGLDFDGADQPVAEMSLSGKFTMTTAAGEEQISFTNLLQANGPPSSGGCP